MPRRPKIRTCTIEADLNGGLPTAFRIWKRGVNTTANGYDVLFDARAARRVMSAYEKHGAEVMIDLEHLSLDDKAANYDPDARGWCRLELRNGELWAVDVRWTPDGVRRLETDKTQRYFSPAFALDEQNRPIRLFNIALVAMPGTDNLEALVAASERTMPMTITMQGALSACLYARALSRRGVAAGMVVRALAEGDGDAGGEVAGVDVAALAEFLGVDVDPAQDPAGFVKALLARIDEIAAKVRGSEPEPEVAPGAEMAEEPKEDMAAAKAIMRVVGAKTATDALITVTEWRQLALEHERQVKKLADERKALDATKRRQLTARLVVCGAETPATAWADDAKTEPAKHLHALSLSELETRCLAFEAAPRAPNFEADKSDKTADQGGAVVTVDGREVRLTADEVKRCKDRGADLERYAGIKLRQGAAVTKKAEG